MASFQLAVKWFRTLYNSLAETFDAMNKLPQNRIYLKYAPWLL